MPLPEQTQPWPPKDLAVVHDKMAEWSAWWTGDTAALQSTYRTASGAPRVRPSQRAGGVTGALARFWWGRAPSTSATANSDHTHIPLAADIARTSADLLFAEAPEIVVPDKPTQAHLEADLEDRIMDVLTGAAESGAALGGTYLRVCFDPAVSDRAFPSIVRADEAIPEFSWGRLRAVTFWSVVGRNDGGTVWWRHLERHEMNTAGVGFIQHGLYQGSSDELGVPVPLQDRPETAALADIVDDQGYVTAGRTKGLNVVYIPNVSPTVAKAWTHVPSAAGLGASDFDGVEPMLDNLDEIHASWMRDIRLAKARLIVARYMLDDHGAGAGAGFDTESEIFSPLKMAQAEEGNVPITPVQFEIRFAEHQASAQEWTERIIRSAGYSVQTFGEGGDGAQQTATEVVARENRSMLTRKRKIRAWRPALQEFVTKLLTVDADVFGRPHNPNDLRVNFGSGVTESDLTRAQTVLALATAQAASKRTLVALQHPEWDDKAIDAEVALILGEAPAPETDPFTFGG